MLLAVLAPELLGPEAFPSDELAGCEVDCPVPLVLLDGWLVCWVDVPALVGWLEGQTVLDKSVRSQYFW